ncbi:MAG: hypothetical protein JNM41_09110 [Flavipsychrobacter sp.]|nr:hypothetical protein [Flavipsychrobacter sp.]
MPNFSFFWQKHYGEIGNCCMTYPLKKLAWINPDNKEAVPRKFEGKQLVIDFIDVNWMYGQKLKWIGWDIQGWLAWTDENGMLYRIKDLKRNEVGQEFEKEVNEVKCELSPMVHTGNPSAEELYRFERDTQRKCGFCPDGQRSGLADEQQEKLQETRKPPIVPAWEKFVSGDAIVEYGPAGKEIMPPPVNVTYPIAVTTVPTTPVTETKKVTKPSGFPEVLPPKKKCPEKGGLYIPEGKGQDSDEMRVLKQVAGKFGAELEVDKDGRVLIKHHSEKDLELDAGFKLLHDIAYNPKKLKLLFTVNNFLIGRDRSTGQSFNYYICDPVHSYLEKKRNGKLVGKYLSQDVNFSKTPRGEADQINESLKLPDMNRWHESNALPEECYDGSTAIPKNVTGKKDILSSDEDAIKNAPQKSQASLAFHALAENFIRSGGYKTGPGGVDFGTAHELAKKIAEKLPQSHPAYSRYPGASATDLSNIKIFEQI